MDINYVINKLTGGQSEKRVDDFLKFLSDKLWELYNDYLMNKEFVGRAEVNQWRFDLPNAKENVPYEKVIEVKSLTNTLLDGIEVQVLEVKGISEETHGLAAEILDDGKKVRISGTPNLDSFRKDGATAESTFDIVLVYKFKGLDLPTEGRPSLELKIPFVINQDPRRL